MSQAPIRVVSILVSFLSLPALAGGLAPVTAGRVAATAPSFEKRVLAQEAIERVYYSHRIDADRPFEQVVDRSVLEHKVRDYLARSVALEHVWNVTVTADALESELARILRDTQDHSRLRELFAALDDDPLLIYECLVRPVLVRRLTQNRFAYDTRIHERERERAETLRRSLLDGSVDPLPPWARRSEVVLVRAGSETEATGRESSDVAYEIGPVEEERRAYVIRILNAVEEDRAAYSVYAVPKRTWDEWRAEELEPRGDYPVSPPEGLALRLPHVESAATRAGAEAECLGDVWENGVLDDPPALRARHTAVWTGSEMIVWGGSDADYGLMAAGMRYDPATDSWTPTSTVDAPSPRDYHTAIWTGSEMIVWGGSRDHTLGAKHPAFASGGRYVRPRFPNVVEGLAMEALPLRVARLNWPATEGAGSYAVTRGEISSLAAGRYGSCLVSEVVQTHHDDPAVPGPRRGYAYLVQAKSLVCGTGPLGDDSSGAPRVNQDPTACP